MPNKLTIQEVQKYIDENANGQCILLSTEYINSHTPLTLKCNICGNEFQRDYDHLKRKRFLCIDCAKKNRSDPSNKLSIEDVKKFINENDINHECTLISTEYINNRTPLTLKCNICGNEFQRDFSHIQRNRFRCETCGEKAGAQKLIYTQEDVEKDIQKSGYHIIGPYTNAGIGVLCSCEKEGHQPFYLIYSNYKFKNQGCPECGKLKMQGSNHWNWKGGVSSLLAYLRDAANDWKYNVVRTYRYCDITGTSKNLEVHHLNINFSDIVHESAQNIGFIFDGKQLKDYDEHQLYQLKQEIKRLHEEKVQGVVLRKDIHRLFHSIYGKENNTPEQYYEFKEKIQKGEIIIDGSYSK